jgi:iron complex transport system substrate-binding protein
MKRYRSGFVIKICCMLMIFGIAALPVAGPSCSGEPPVLPLPAGSPAGKASPLVVTGPDGVTIPLPSLPRRLVVVGQAPFIALHLLYAFPEGKQRLVGYERKYNIVEKFLPLIDTALDQKTVLGTNPGPEEIAALKPDLVIVKSGNAGPLSRSLAILGIPMLHLGLENPDMFLKDVETIGRVLGNPGRAEEIIAYYRSRLDILQTGLSGKPADRRPRVLVIDYNDKAGNISVKVPARSWIQTIQAGLAGGNPVWTDHISIQDGWQIVGFEQIAAWNPEKIFTIVGFRQDGCQVMASLRANTQWRELSALIHREFYLFPQDIYGWDTPDPRWILGALWLATKMYPAEFAPVEMTQEIYTFFHRLYGLEKTIVDMEILPKVQLNGCPW